MKYLFVMTTSNNVVNFRLSLIKTIVKNGDQVIVIANDNDKKEEIVNACSSFYCVENNNRSINPFRSLKYKRDICNIIKTIKPDVVFTFQSKPNTFGVMAAKKCGVKRIFSMVEGAGAPFTYNSFKWRLIRRVEEYLFRKAFKSIDGVFFLNNEDADEFKNKRIVKDNQIHIINGIGVDLELFKFSNLDVDSTTFLMVARMLKAKGTIDYCRCAEIVKKEFPTACFKYLGSEGDLRIKDIRYYIDNGIIEYVGNVDDVKPYLQECLMMILPSTYREGKPMSIMEAQAVGRPIITTNNIGCRDTVVDGYNGYIIEKHDVEKLAEKCIFALNNKGTIKQMAINARKFAEENFSAVIINEQILRIVNGK